MDQKTIETFALNLDSAIKAGYAVSKIEAWKSESDGRVIVAALDRSGSVLVALGLESNDRLEEIEVAFSVAAGMIAALNEFSKRLN